MGYDDSVMCLLHHPAIVSHVLKLLNNITIQKYKSVQEKDRSACL